MNAYSPKSADPLWHQSAEAQALLASCAANPPATKAAVAPIGNEKWWSGETVQRFDRNDDRVDALSRLSNAAHEVTCRGPNASAINKAWRSVDDVIAQAIAAGARRKAA